MQADQKEIQRSLGVLFQPGDTIELRSLGDRVGNGYFRNQDALAQAALDLSNAGQNVYCCLNPVDGQLYARRADQFGPAKRGEGASDQDVPRRRWLLIDVDAVRPAGVSATDEQKQAAITLARTLYTSLQDRLSSSCLVCADSGNGAHILIRLPDVPADDRSRWICERFLQQLDQRFSNAQAKIDCTTHNASRICTLYGTIKRKGSDIPEQPHRASRLVHVPDDLQPADFEQLAAMAGPYQEQLALQPNSNGSALDIEQLLEQRQIEYSRDDQYRTSSGELATRYALEVCPFEPEHLGSAVLLQFPSGAVAFRCLGDRCAGKGWQDLKQIWQLPRPIAAADITTASRPALPQPAGLLIVKSTDVQIEPIDWLQQDRLVVGGINLLAGRGGIGKTYFLCDLVARITNDRLTAPNGQPLKHGRVLYSTGEDHIAKVIEGRMQQHGVHRDRLEYIKGLPAGQYVRLLDVIEHCDLLRDALRQRPDTVALVLDPISSFSGETDSNKVAQVRRFTAVLTQLAEEHNIAILGVHHFNKGKRDFAGDSISGSHAYRDAARSIWLFALDTDDPTRRLCVCDKHNWAEQRPTGLAYRIAGGRIQYGAEPLEMTSDELLAQGNQQQLDIACAWLVAQLSAGPQPALNLQMAAAAEGIADRTLHRAKKSLGVVSKRLDGTWHWLLPTATDQQ